MSKFENQMNFKRLHGSNSAVIEIDASNRIRVTKNTIQKSARQMVQNSRDAFSSGKTKPLKFRKEQLRNFIKMLEENREEFELALHKDLRKAKMEANLYEIDIAIGEAWHLLAHLDEYARRKRMPQVLTAFFDGLFQYSDPYGVVLVMGPWNYPVSVSLGPMAGAIAGGNTVIFKPSDIAAYTAQTMKNLIPKYLDKDCYQVFLGGVSETTELLEERFDYIFFTGSVGVGKIVHQAAAKHLTPTTLELGGKSPVYMDDSVNMDVVAHRLVWGKCVNAGQACVAPDYLLCTKEVQDKFIEYARKILFEYYGTDPKASLDISRMVSKRHYDRLEGFLKNSNIALGGRTDPRDLYIAPTILKDVNPDHPIMKEEIFGPILPIVLIKTLEEAIEFINAREKPLALYVFTRKKKVYEAFINNTSSGSLIVNDNLMQFGAHTLPFGGVGNSGMGSYHSKNSFDTFVHKKSVMIRGMNPLLEWVGSCRYPPYSPTKMFCLGTLMTVKFEMSLSQLVPVAIFFLGVASAFCTEFIIKTMMSENHQE